MVIARWSLPSNGQHKCFCLFFANSHSRFFLRIFLPQLLPRSLRSGAAQQGMPRRTDAHARWGMRLAAGPSSQRASARSSRKAGSGPAALTWASPERRGKRSLRSHGNDSAPSLNPCMRVARRGGAQEAHSPPARARAYGGRMRLPSPNARPPRRRRRRGGSGENG